MNGKKMLFCFAVLAVLCLVLTGCSKKPAPTQSTSGGGAQPAADIKAMTVQQIRDMATKLKGQINAAIAEKDKFDATVKNLSAEDMLKKAEEIKASVDKLDSKISDLKAKLQSCLDELKKRGESITGLEL